MEIKKIEIKEYETEFTVVIPKQFPEFERRLFALVREFNELMDDQSHPCYNCTDMTMDGCRNCPNEVEALAMVDEEMEQAKVDEQKYREFLERKNADPHQQVHDEYDRMAEEYHEEPPYDLIAEQEMHKKRENDAAMYYDSHQEPPWE